ncbi:hypothetical protein HY469_05275 [Candidatus Roizmanbacteria bacterium]|nr:hypothetical protein [Candidatus Roizmanbacteria bacterium]
MSEDFNITVKAKDIYDGVCRLELKMEEMIVRQKETNGKIKDHALRLDRLEIFQVKTATIWGGIAVVSSTVLTIIINNFS